MKNYVKPLIIANAELAEGVFASSGNNCYTFNAEIKQCPELGNEVYTIQIDGQHNANHHSTTRTVVIIFNIPVQYVSSNASTYTELGNELRLTFTDGINGAYHNNGIDNIGLGQLKVKASSGLVILNCYSIYCNERCGQH